MTDDIVTRLSTEEMTKAYRKTFPTVVTVEDAMRQALEVFDEVERLRAEVNLWIDAAGRFAESETAQDHHNAIEYFMKAVRGE